ncbi:protein Abitram-like isoform X1 [Biomphalaria glabrata]|uniref:Protein Abitram n=1 Tax=Biomphalaria glabrata TaxID=6526 RepID=A0A2C9KZI2_BIOGL|nr:protein Abitram-like isoform X1 [Biomphalaria glabrata]
MIESDFESPLPHRSNHNDKPPSVIERYFKKRYKTDNKYEDQLVLTHSNRVCVVCVANSHPLIEQKKSVTSVSFGEEGWNRLDNKFSGKSKRGAQWLDCKAPLCEVTCSDGTKYTLVCCVKGQLIEVNENLQKTPQLLIDKPHGEGYLAVILPGLKWFEHEMKQLKSEEDYQNELEKRLHNS